MPLATGTIAATLFLNLPFWSVYDHSFGGLSPLFVAPSIALATVLLSALFFLGPKLRTQQTGNAWENLLVSSLGQVPALLIRGCLVVFLVIWCSGFASMFMYLAQWTWPQANGVWIVRAAFGFVFLTAVLDLNGPAKFTVRLGIALLIASFLRVRDGWPALWDASHPEVKDLGYIFWHGTSVLGMGIAPLLLLLAKGSEPAGDGKQETRAAILKVAAPLFAALVALHLICTSVGASSAYTPSVTPNILMALWGRSARFSMQWQSMIVAVASFGALRFGAHALCDTLSLKLANKAVRWLVLSCVIAVATWPIEPSAWQSLAHVRDVLVSVLTAVAALLTADYLSQRSHSQPQRNFVSRGILAVSCGLLGFAGTAYWIGEDWWSPGFLPAYGVTFAVAYFGATMGTGKGELNQNASAVGP